MATFTHPEEQKTFAVEVSRHALRAIAYILPIRNLVAQRDNSRAFNEGEFVQECFERGLWDRMAEVVGREDSILRAVFEAGSPELREEMRAALEGWVTKLPEDVRKRYRIPPAPTYTLPKQTED
jgi:hypothetical protein